MLSKFKPQGKIKVQLYSRATLSRESNLNYIQPIVCQTSRSGTIFVYEIGDRAYRYSAFKVENINNSITYQHYRFYYNSTAFFRES